MLASSSPSVCSAGPGSGLRAASRSHGGLQPNQRLQLAGANRPELRLGADHRWRTVERGIRNARAVRPQLNREALGRARFQREHRGPNESDMAKVTGPPTCSFCGSREGSHYVSGPHRRYICQACIEQPGLREPVPANATCAFCDRRIGARRRWWQRERVEAVTARQGLVVCHLCQGLMREILAEAPPFAEPPAIG